jgi:hypothetical protein
MRSWEFLPLPLAVPFIQLYPSHFFISLQIILIPLSCASLSPPDPPQIFVSLISIRDPLNTPPPTMAVEVTLKNGEIVTVNGHSHLSNLSPHVYEGF